jgi:ubiquinone/menaquinone biosynthesis C-methylase UbiE
MPNYNKLQTVIGFNMHQKYFLFNLIMKRLPGRLIASQARKPTGWMGKVLMTAAFDQGNARLNDFIFDHLKLTPTDQILEIGFGSGQLFQKILKVVTGTKVCGVDFSNDMVTRLQKHLRKSKNFDQNFELKQGEVSALPYAENTFDKICSANTLYFWPKPLEDAKQILKVLKPGGVLLLGFRVRAQMEKIPFIQHGFTIYSPEEVQKLLLEAGFKSVEILSRKEAAGFDSYIALAKK